MEPLNDQLTGLAKMSLAQLRAEWRRVHRSSPPSLSADLLRRGIAYRIQEKRYGALSAKAARDLVRHATGPSETSIGPRSDINLRAGTRLVRSWRGTTYTVAVAEDGFVFDGERYTSLTAIARGITGAAWSGPRFFGLTRERQSNHA